MCAQPARIEPARPRTFYWPWPHHVFYSNLRHTSHCCCNKNPLAEQLDNILLVKGLE